MRRGILVAAAHPTMVGVAQIGMSDDATHLSEDSTVTGPALPRAEGRRTRRASAPVEAGERYEIGEVIGRGGMGEVLAAYDRQIGREVAIKRLRPERTTPASLSRFLREARIQGRLDHPAIPPVYEIGEDAAGRPFFVMKRLAGVTLARILENPEHRVAIQRLLRAFVEICNAIELAHSRGIVHRDLKPSNMLLGSFGEVYVLDWGVARILDELDTPDRHPSALHDVDLTATGLVVGTGGYMAPEQVTAERDIDARADVYALGCVLFEILSGQRRHPRGMAGMQSAVAGAAIAPSTIRDGVPRELDELCIRATEVDRDRRIQSARELGEAVQRYLDGDRDHAARNELARAHLEAARATLLGSLDNESRRRVAMREAGRALALDPRLEGAAELVGHLMLEPPVATPRAVTEELAHIDGCEAARQGRLAIGLYAGYLSLAPIFFVLGVRDPLYLGMLAGVAACNVILQVMLLRRTQLSLKIANALANAALVGVIARMFTPFLLAPGIGAVTLMAIALHPRADRREILANGILSVAAILGVRLAEVIGICSVTIVDRGDHIILSPPVTGISSVPAAWGLVVFTVTLCAIAGVLACTAVQRARDARRKLHIQAWQLRQLLS